MSSSKKHTLDSDEEDDVVEEDKLEDSDIEGQEDAEVDIEDGIRFTPFHMKDELAEGHFDSDGMYIFNKNKDEIADKWIEDVNWSEVKNTEALLKRKREKEEERIAFEASEVALNVDDAKTKMLLLMQPGETVLTAIKRLGKDKVVPTWKKKKLDKDRIDNKSNLVDNSEKLNELIGYADKLLLDGHISIYSDTFEKITLQLNQQKSISESVNLDRLGVDCSASGAAAPIAVDDVDIFGEPVLNKNSDYAVKKSVVSSPIILPSDEIQWEFKWKNEAEAELHGPYSTQQMQQWVDEEYFKDGVFVRKFKHQDSDFYTSRRIDFSLYL